MYKIRQVDVNNSTGNGVAKELTCIIHGDELRLGIYGKYGGTRWAIGKKCDNYNSIIKKINFSRKEKEKL